MKLLQAFFPAPNVCSKMYFKHLEWAVAAMLAYKTVSGNKDFKKLVHLSLQFLAFCLSMVGVWAALKFHNDKGIDNFYSLHSWLGLACLFLFAIQVFFLISFPFYVYIFYFYNKMLTIHLHSGLLDLQPSGTQVGRETAKRASFLGMFSLEYIFTPLLLLLLPPGF